MEDDVLRKHAAAVFIEVCDYFKEHAIEPIESIGIMILVTDTLIDAIKQVKVEEVVNKEPV